MEPHRCYAHTIEGRPEEDWQELAVHLTATAGLAAGFAAPFASAEWGRLAGLWHDLGKYRPEFQARLRGASGEVDHGVVGALLARARPGDDGWPLAFVIAGHHGGLANLVSADVTSPSPLTGRLSDNAGLAEEVLPLVPAELRNAAFPQLPSRFLTRPASVVTAQTMRRSLEFWTRFLFSALTDADFLDTEKFMRPGTRRAALASYDPIAVLRQRLDAHVHTKSATADPTPVNQVRAEVLRHCREAADLPPGFFSLTVPTGGGKTLSAMAFALRHAVRYGMERIIAVIPYTSIIEQNAERYREALGTGNVLEHHSNTDPEKETDAGRLASENWDTPVVITTSVQFFESLFANRPSACRKLHNVARSVIILDEVQALPSRFLLAILEGLQELVAHFGCSVVLSTATQPALAQREGFPQGLQNVSEIIPEPAALARNLRRIGIEWPDVDAAPVAWPALAKELAAHRQVLAVVHRREDARELARLLADLRPQEEVFHLSALMCPRHRSDVLAAINTALEEERPCRLVSTQLIEAGVDIDFPVVYRALGGLDSIVQAAGRCNREGRAEQGRVVVFRAPTLPPRGTPKKGLEIMEGMLRQYGVTLDPAAPGFFEEYFRSLYFTENLDAAGIQTEREQFSFANVAARFKLIEDGYSQPVVVPYGDAEERVAALRREGPTRENLRALQPFLVNVYEQDLKRLEEEGSLEVVAETVRFLVPAFRRYSARYGLAAGGQANIDPEDLVVHR